MQLDCLTAKARETLIEARRVQVSGDTSIGVYFSQNLKRTPDKVVEAGRKRTDEFLSTEHLLDPLSLRLIEGVFKPGDSIKITAGDGSLVFAAAPAKPK